SLHDALPISPDQETGGAVEPPPPPQKSARCSHAKFMSSTVSRFSQAPQSYVLIPVPDGAVPIHACVTPPATHTVQSHPHIFFKNMRGQPQISSASLGVELRLIDHEQVSPRQIQLKAQSPWLCGELARISIVTRASQ